MKRRSFLKAVPALAAFSHLPAFVHHEPKQRHLIALGSTASLLAVGSNFGFDTVTLVTDRKPKFVSDEFEFITFSPPDSAFNFLGEHKFLKKEPFQIIDIPIALRNTIRKKKGEVVIFAALGKYTGTVLSKSISQEFEGKENLSFVNSIPFSFEGSYFQDQSKLVAAEISSKHKCQTLHLEDIRERFGNLGIRSAFKKVDDEIDRRLSS